MSSGILHPGMSTDHGVGQDNDSTLVDQTAGLSLAEKGHLDGEHHHPNGGVVVPEHIVNEDREDDSGLQHQDHEHSMNLGSALATHPVGDDLPNGEHQTRPSMGDRPSRSYASQQIPIVTTYEPELPDNASINKRKSIAGSKRAPSRSSIREGETGTIRSPSRAASTRGVEPSIRAVEPSIKSPSIKSPSIAPAGETGTLKTHSRPPSVKAGTIAGTVRSPSRAGSIQGDHDAGTVRSASRAGSIKTYDHEQQSGRPASVAGSIRRPDSRLGAVAAGTAGGAAIGDVITHDRQRELQQERPRVSLQDSGAQQPQHQQQRSLSPRPTSPFGHRPQPNLMTVTEDGNEGRYDSRNDRYSGMQRSGTVLSRAGTQGRNGTLSRGMNGGTVGSRRGAFGRGAGASIGTQPEEVLGRDDIHARAELSERILDDATLRQLSTMEKKDAARLAKVIKAEGKSEAKSVTASIKELERLTKHQRESASAERKSQLRLSKWTSKEHKARLRFLKEKERYERIEGELRNAENDYEERRDHAAGLTAQVAEKTQELDDLRGQKAADDRERAVKLLALKNPAHS